MSTRLLVMVGDVTDDAGDCVDYVVPDPHSYIVGIPVAEGATPGDNFSWDGAGTTIGPGGGSSDLYTVLDAGGIQYFRILGNTSSIGGGEQIDGHLLLNGSIIHSMSLVCDTPGIQEGILEAPGGSADAVHVDPGDTIQFSATATSDTWTEFAMIIVIDADNPLSTLIGIGVVWNPNT